jgi:hypothetical protein
MKATITAAKYPTNRTPATGLSPFKRRITPTTRTPVLKPIIAGQILRS